MADHAAVVAQPVLINVVLVPRVLPLADLERQRKPPLDLRQLDAGRERRIAEAQAVVGRRVFAGIDRKSTCLNSSHTVISYAVFCLKKKKVNSATTRNTFGRHVSTTRT